MYGNKIFNQNNNFKLFKTLTINFYLLRNINNLNIIIAIYMIKVCVV